VSRAGQAPGRHRAAAGWRPGWGDRALVALGGQTGLGLALGAVWLALAPRPAARWTGLLWLGEGDYGFGAAQDVWFGVLTGVAGLAAGACLAGLAGRPAAGRRAGLWLGGGAAGAVACLFSGGALSGGLGPPAVGAVARAPLVLTSPGLLALWLLAEALVATGALAWRAMFGRTW
jgi:hypothetical protein